MNIETNTLREAIEFGTKTNPIWPFTAFIVDDKNNVLVKATDCAHISPLFHAESLAIHMMIQNQLINLKDLTLITTAEPDPLSQSAIYWARVTHDIIIDRVIYGCPLTKIKELWKFGIDISAREIMAKSTAQSVTFKGPILEDECYQLFLDAKERQKHPHPARNTLSHNVEDFFEIIPDIHSYLEKVEDEEDIKEADLAYEEYQREGGTQYSEAQKELGLD